MSGSHFEVRRFGCPPFVLAGGGKIKRYVYKFQLLYRVIYILFIHKILEFFGCRVTPEVLRNVSSG